MSSKPSVRGDIAFNAAPACRTLLDVFVRRAEFNRKCVMASFLDDKGVEVAATRRTNLQMAAEVEALASWLESQKGLTPGSRVGLVFLPCVEFVTAYLACQFARLVPLPLPPPLRLSVDLPGFAALVQSTGCAAVISHGDYTSLKTLLSAKNVMTRLFSFAKSAVAWPDVKWLEVDGAVAKARKQRLRSAERPALIAKLKQRAQAVDAADVAYLQITSGTTSKPKAVTITHANALYNAVMAESVEYVRPEQRGASDGPLDVMGSVYRQRPLLGDGDWHSVLCWVPYYHDFFLAHLSAALVTAGNFLIMSPLSFVKTPLVWLQACARYNAFVSGGPNFAWELVLAKSSPADLRALDLSQLHVAMSGGEMVRPDTVRRFCAAVPSLQREDFVNAYGIAEHVSACILGRTTAARLLHVDQQALVRDHRVLIVGNHDDERTLAIVPSGDRVLRPHALRPFPPTVVAIVDPDSLDELPDDRIGEIWVSSPSVCQGYWGWSDDDNAATFRAVPRSRQPTDCPARQQAASFLRTGDRGFVHNEQLYIIGRYKTVLIIQGHNYEPSDIEFQLNSCHSLVRPGNCALLAVSNAATGTEDAVLIVEVRDASVPVSALKELADFLHKTVSECSGLAVAEIVLCPPRTAMSKTSSGKLKRQEILGRYLDGKLTPLFRTREFLPASSDSPAVAASSSSPSTTSLSSSSSSPPSSPSSARRSSPSSSRRSSSSSKNKKSSSSSSSRKSKKSLKSSRPAPSDPRAKHSSGDLVTPRSGSSIRSRSSSTPRRSQAELQEWVFNAIAASIGCNVDDLTLDSNIASLGLTSMMLVNFADQFEQKYGSAVSVHHLFTCSTLAEVLNLLADRLTQGATDAAASQPETSDSQAEQQQQQQEQPDKSAATPPAIAGIGLKLPMGITEMSDLWDAIQRQESTIGRVPATDPRFAGKELPAYASTYGAADFDDLNEVAARFPPELRFAELSLTERLALRVVAAGLVDAKLLVEDPARKRLAIAPEAGVVGLIYTQGHVSLKAAPAKTLSTVSYAFRLGGPSFVLDTACSSGAVALDQALLLLEQNRCDTVLLVGVTLLRPMPKEVRAMLSAGAAVRSFDAAADGWLPGEAAACLVVTKRPCAEPHAFVYGRGVGTGSRFSATGVSSEANVNALRLALASSGLKPDELCLGELSGSASQLADLLELSAVQQLLQTPDSQPDSLVISSTAPFFGHTANCASLVQMCKLVVELRVSSVPANPSTTVLNPEFDWRDFRRCVIPLQGSVATLPQQAVRFGFTCSLSAAGPTGCVILGVPID